MSNRFLLVWTPANLYRFGFVLVNLKLIDHLILRNRSELRRNVLLMSASEEESLPPGERTQKRRRNQVSANPSLWLIWAEGM